ncbi:lytic murein transglycosylase B [Alcaligenaceae bacterium]|nr:lytic murein transglycosylase B [Alcaligenaceae bacterium]
MFRRTRILQAVLLALLTTACASQQTTDTAQPRMAAAAAGGGAPAPLAGVNPADDAPEIHAGRSEVSSRPFSTSAGVLDPDIEAFALEVADLRQLPLEHVRALLLEAQYNATAARLMAPSGTRIRRSWVTYRNRFVEPVRIRSGRQFWEENAADLHRTQQEYGVPAAIIVAIIGVETVYGRHTGDFRVLDALATLGFRYPDAKRPERGHLFRNQLADLIQLDYEKKLNARQVSGSFAGAMGLPQFMPGSLMRYAADGDHDGRIDLHGSTTDAIVSVARFLRLHGWVPGLPVFAPVTPPANAGALVTGGLTPTLNWAQLSAAGATAPPGAASWKQHEMGVVNLVDEPRDTVEYRVGTPNFFALTHYNRSYFYASSVADLAQELEHRMGARALPAPATAQLNTPVDR